MDKGFIIRPERELFWETTEGNSEWARWAHLACSAGSQSEHRFTSSCHIIMIENTKSNTPFVLTEVLMK